MKLDQMRTIDIRTVDPLSLVDADTISVDMDLPNQERMLNVLNQMGGNPYFFRSRDNIAVKVCYMDTPVTLDERMESYLQTL